MARNQGAIARAARARFAELLSKHLTNGTRPRGSGEPWTYAQFAQEVQSTRGNDFVSPRSVSNWVRGRALPVEIQPILRALFGPSGASLHEEEQSELLSAFRAARAEAIGREQFEALRPHTGYQRETVDTLQSYIVSSPLNIDFSLISISVVIGSRSNQLSPLDTLVDIPHNGNASFTLATDFADFVDHLLHDIPEYYALDSRDDFFNSINNNGAIVYFGSLRSASTEQISKLPQLLKDFGAFLNDNFELGYSVYPPL